MTAHQTTPSSAWLVAFKLAPHEVASAATRPLLAWLVVTLRWFAFLAAVLLTNAAVWGDASLPASPRGVALVALALASVLAAIAVWLAHRQRPGSAPASDVA
jgi:hypothetical protein